MFRKRRWSLLAVGTLLTVLASTLVFGSPAQAQPGSSLGVPFTYYPTGMPYGSSVLPVTIVAGDCRVKGVNQVDPDRASIFVEDRGDFYDANNVLVANTKVTWYADVYTISTWFGDVWHATFIFRNAGGAELFRVYFDATLLGSHTVNHYTLDQTITPTAYQVATIASVDWLGDC